MDINRKKGVFLLEILADSSINQPTEIYLPEIHFPNGYNLEAPGFNLI